MGGYSISRPGDSADFFALRDYQSGDSIRRINWKASAKAGKTIVNQVTRDSFARILLILDMRAKEGVGGRDAPRVHAGRAAASLLTYHERAKDHLQVLLVGSDATLASHESNPRLPDLLAAIASTAPGGDCSLAEAIRSHVHLVRPRTPVYLLTSGALDADLVEAAAMLSTLEARPWLIAPEWPALADDPAEARAARVSREHALAGARGAGTTVVEWDGQEMLEASLVHP
jgi:uncharacterized protein (DUF58 family)